MAASGPRLPPDKTLGEFSQLDTNYEGSFRPARVGLRLALEAGKMRNPLRMPQSSAPWSARRPLSAGRTSQGARPLSAGARKSPGARGTSAPRAGSTAKSREEPPSPERTAAAVAVRVAVTRRDATHLRKTIDEAQEIGVDNRTLDYAKGKLVDLERKSSDRGPAMLQPQRIELPSYLNTPPRRCDGDPITPEDRMSTMRKVQDLELLTFACRRAGKSREEGRAHFSLGVFRDNLAQYQKAIESYNNFLKICTSCNDAQGCALAYHCIAVDHQLLGENDKPEMLRKAIMYHNKHRENSDAVGKFVAHLNMGLAYAGLGEREASTVNHQYALRYALQLHSQEGQSLAIGSLGFSAGMYDKDPEKMRCLIERYIELCDILKQPRNQATALRKLGIIADQKGESEQSIGYFQQAIDAAKAQGDSEAEKDCSVRLGIAAGQARMAEHISNILQQSVVGKP